MYRGFGKYEETASSPDSSVILGFVLVLAVTCGAFAWVSDYGLRTDRSVRVYQHTSAPALSGGSDIAATSGQEIDPIRTSSTATDEGTDASSDLRAASVQCDIDACANAYRSFRVSDCTFQPYEGPRRLCTR
jgi:hypothetical protein